MSDKNKCPNCGGYGYIEVFVGYDGGYGFPDYSSETCVVCNGTGKKAQ